MLRDANGKLHGTVTCNLKNGVTIVTEYQHGIRHGKSLVYRDGTLVQESTFEHGAMVSVKQLGNPGDQERMLLTIDCLSNFRPKHGLISVKHFHLVTTTNDLEIRLHLLNKNYKSSNLALIKAHSDITGFISSDSTGLAWNADYAISFSLIEKRSSNRLLVAQLEIDNIVKECLDEVATTGNLPAETAAYLKLKCL